MSIEFVIHLNGIIKHILHYGLFLLTSPKQKLV